MYFFCLYYILSIANLCLRKVTIYDVKYKKGESLRILIDPI